MQPNSTRWLFVLVALFAAGCAAVVPAPRTAGVIERSSSLGKIAHVIIVVQENRTVDNFFQGFPGANTQSYGYDSKGNRIALRPISIVTNFDIRHAHSDWINEYDNGRMDGFDKALPVEINGTPSPPPDPAYSYVPESHLLPYWTMARQYAFADEMFQTNEGPSFAAHMYLAAATSATDDSDVWYAEDDPHPPHGGITGGCSSPPGSTDTLINPWTNATSIAYPCFTHRTLFDALDAAHVSWKYYEPRLGAGLWYAPDDYWQIFNGPDYQNVIAPQTRTLDDAAQGTLAGVSWVIPAAAESDHAGSTDGSGPGWVAQIVNAVGRGPQWNSTAIFVVWDDWGGWYDHAAPFIKPNNYELSFRVPLIVVSPYAKAAYVGHTQYEFGS